MRAEELRIPSARQRNLPDDATWEEIDAYDLDQQRQESARHRKLADSATWDEIAAFDVGYARRCEDVSFGLAETAGEDEIKRCRDDYSRLWNARDAELPVTATPEEIDAKLDLDRCRLRALELKLPETSTCQEIESYEVRQLVVSRGYPDTITTRDEFWQYDREIRRRQFARELGLPETATDEELDSGYKANYYRKLVEQHGLSPSMSYEAIDAYVNWKQSEEHGWPVMESPEALEVERVRKAKLYGLRDDATWYNIKGYENQQADAIRLRELLALPRSTSEQVIKQCVDERIRKFEARKLGLPESTLRPDIERFQKRDEFLKRGLSPLAPFLEIYYYDLEQRRKQELQELELSEPASQLEIAKAKRKRSLRDLARSKGLPDTATQEECDACDEDQKRKNWARQADLPETASWDEIFRSDSHRIREARRCGLPDSTTWEEMEQWRYRIIREAQARALGLPETASAEEISRAYDDNQRMSEAQAAGLDRTASWDEIRQRQQEIGHVERRLSQGLPEWLTDEEVYECELLIDPERYNSGW